MYCWGSMKHGELGLGGLEEEIITLPKLSPFTKAEQISQGMHNFIYTTSIYSSGNPYELYSYYCFCFFQLVLVTTMQSFCSQMVKFIPLVAMTRASWVGVMRSH